MKSLVNLSLVVFVLVLLLAAQARSQGWYTQSSGVSNSLNAVFLTDANTGTVAGTSGTILHTTNGGLTWPTQSSGVSQSLNGVFFSSAATGTVVGSSGTILRTTNAGASWTTQSSGTSQNLNGVFFTDVNNGTVVGSSGTILRTSNGGGLWTNASIGSNQLSAVVFPTSSVGIIAGNGGTILRTTNGGATWTAQSAGTSSNLMGVSFTDANTGTVVGAGGIIYRTTNGGANWLAQSSGTGEALRGVFFTSQTKGTAVGEDGTILRTTNGGTTWTAQSSGTEKDLSGVHFSDDNTGNAVGSSGKILRTTTGGIICPTITLSPLSLPNGNAGTAYSQTIISSGGVAPYTYSVTSGVLPTGLTLSSTGALSGIPSTAGTYSFTITSRDDNRCPGDRSYSITIVCALITISPAALPTGTEGTFYTQSLSAGGGAPPYTFAVTAGSLPAGLNLSASGVLSGTPTSVGSSSFTVTATDAQLCSANKGYALTVNCPTMTVSPASLPGGIVGASYSQTLSGSGGTAPYTFLVTGGSLPPGLALSSSGVLSGIPTSVGSFSVSVTATDAQACTTSKTYAITINCPAIVLGPSLFPGGSVGVAYNQSMSGSGGTSPYTFAVTAGSLPAGLSLSSSGVLSGTPSAAGSFAFTVTGTDFQQCTANHSYTLIIDCPVISITPSSLPAGTISAAYNQSLSASGGTAPYTYAVSSGTLPPGITLSAGGTLFGTPTTPGNYNFAVTTTDAQGCTGVRSYTLLIDCPTIDVSPASISSSIVGISYATTFTASGGFAPYTFNITSGSLPNGLGLSSSGLLSGTPSESGTFTFTVTAVDAHGCPGSHSYILTVSCPLISLSSIPTGTIGVAYSHTITTTNATNPVVFGVTGGALPPGLTLSSAGVLSGTPTAPGSFTFTITATDAHACTGVQSYSVSMNCPTISLSGLPNGTVGASYNQTVTSTGGTPPYTYVHSAGTLPPGLSLSSLGNLSGIVSSAGSYTFTITATDGNGCNGSQTYTVAFSCNPVTLSPASLPNGTAGIGYSQTMTGSGGTAPYTFTTSNGTVPPGLSLSSGGNFTGTPTTDGVYSFDMTVEDTYGCSQTQGYSITIGSCPTISIAPGSLGNGTLGVLYNVTFTASGGSAPYSFTQAGGTIPPGLSLSGSGGLSGTPSSAGSYTFTVTTTDNIGCTATRSYTLIICSTIDLSSLPNGTVGTSYSGTVATTGGTAPFSFAQTSGTLPTGLSLSSGGILSGTPTNAGGFSFTIDVTDANGCTGSRSYALTMDCPAVAISPSTLPNGRVGVSYSETMLGSVGTAPYSFSLSGGTLPAGLILASNGLISGTPTTATSYSFTIVATDAHGCSAGQSYTLVIDCPVISLAPTALPPGTVGSTYTETITAAGGTAPYNFTLASGSVPDGLTLLSSGALSGTPTASGNFSFSVLAIDAQACTGTRSYTVVISCPTITIAPLSLPNESTGSAYSQTVSASGGSGPYSFSISSGSLPGGLGMTAGGVITGTPTTVGSSTFTVTATDLHHCSANRSYSISIGCPVISISPSTLGNGIVGSHYDLTFVGSGGTSPYSCAVSSGSLPPGLSLSPTGVLSGTPTQVGTFNFTISSTDAQSCAGNHSYTLIIGCPPITFTPAVLPAGTEGSLYSQTITAGGGTAPYTFSLQSGIIPSGVTLSVSGLLAGTPSTVGTYSFTVKATDAQGCAGTINYQLTTNCANISVSPSLLPSGSIGILYNQTITASGGISPYSFSLAGGALPSGVTLSAAGILSGTPTVGGDFNITITASDAAGCSVSQSYALSVGSTPGFSLAPTTLTFPSSLVGATRHDSVTVTNPGTGTLTVFSASSDNGNFNVTPSSGTIMPGAGKKFYVTFSPAAVGSKSGNIIFTHTAAGSPDTVLVQGTGVAPVFSILTSISFGQVLLGSSKEDSIDVQNSGATTLTISSVVTDNAEFGVSPASSVLPPGAIQRFLVTFAPTSIGLKSGNVVFTHDGAATPNLVPINGTGVVNVTILKFKDADGSTSTTADRQPWPWHLILYSDSVSPGTIVAEADSTALSTPVGQIGMYIACEADSSPSWTRINGNRTRYDTIMIVASSKIDTFINFKMNGIIVRKFEDRDGIFATTGDQNPKPWHLEIRKDSLRGTLLSAGNGSSLTASNLGDGVYYCVEADSAGWVHLGYALNGNYTSGSDNALRVVVSNGADITVDFINARSAFYKTYRSFSPQSLSQLIPTKKKAVARRFCTQFVNTTGQPVNGLRIFFTRNSLASVVVNITNSAPFPNSFSLDGRLWDFTGTSIANLETVFVCGISNFARTLNIIEWKWMVNGIPQSRRPGFAPADQTPMLAMPNFANIRNEVFTQGGFSLPRADGMVIGIPRTDSVKTFGWVRMRSSKALQKSLLDRSGYHVNFPRGFDRFINGQPFVKEQKFLRPIKQNNHLFGEIAVLKFAITSSALAITPNGFGELIYDEGPGNPLSGLTLSQIAARVDSALTLWRGIALHGWNYDNFDSTLAKINRAFDGAVDTEQYAAKMVIEGVRPVVDVAFLRPNPNAIPLKIDPIMTPGNELPAEFALYQNYPNPFNPLTTIEFDLPQQAMVSLKVYDILGQEIASLVDHDLMEEGNYSVDFDAERFASGVYFYRLIMEPTREDETDGFLQTYTSVKKMLLVK